MGSDWVQSGFRVGSLLAPGGSTLVSGLVQSGFTFGINLGSETVQIGGFNLGRLGSYWVQSVFGFSARLVPGVQVWFNVWFILGSTWVQI